MPRCVRCDAGLVSKPEGILASLGLAGADGYECSSCGSVLCEECYRKRRRELGGSRHDVCSTCEGVIQHR